MPDEIRIDEDASDRAVERLREERETDRLREAWKRRREEREVEHLRRLREAWERRRRSEPPVDDQPLPGYATRPDRRTVFVSKQPGSVLVQTRVESEEPGGPIGDLSAVVEPGGSLYGLPFEFWDALEPGEYRITFRGGLA
jgi:hypothetical protein